MLVSQIIQEINSLADDQIENTKILAWVNDALYAIGSEVNATFPNMENVTDNLDTVLPRKWQTLLVKLYATARLKQQDSSQFEYQDLYSQFERYLSDYASIQDVVPDKFKDLEPKSAIIINGTTFYAEGGDTVYSVAEDESVTPESILSENVDSDGKSTLTFIGDNAAEGAFGDNWYRWDN